MIAKISKGSGFDGCLRYNLDKAKGHLIDTNMDISKGASPTKLATQFRDYSKLNDNCKKPVLHIPISFSKKDNLTEEQMKQAALMFLERFETKMNGGIKPEGSRPYVIIRHTDTDHQHLHIITSRVDSQGKVLKDSNDYKEANSICRELEKELGLDIVNSIKTTGGKGIDLKEINMEKRKKAERSDYITPRKELIAKVNRASSLAGGGKRPFSNFISELKKQGVEVYINTSADHNKINGISYSLIHDKEKRIFKGSALGKDFTWNKLLTKVDFNPARDKDLVILLANKERFTSKILSETEIKTIKNDFKKNLVLYQTRGKTPEVFNLEYRINKIDFTQKRALHIEKMNEEWKGNNYRTDPIKYFENVYKTEHLRQHKAALNNHFALSKDDKRAVLNESINTKSELAGHLKTFMKGEGFEYSHSVNDRIKTLHFTSEDNKELKELCLKWNQKDYTISPMAYVYDRVQLHQAHFKENLLKSLDRMSAKYPQLDNFSNPELTKDLLKIADNTNFDNRVPSALLKLDKEILSNLHEDKQKEFTNQKVLSFVNNEINKESKGVVTSVQTDKADQSYLQNEPSAIAEMFQGIGAGATSGGIQDDSHVKPKKKKRKPRKIE